MNSNPPKLKNLSPLIPAGKDVQKSIEFYEKLGAEETSLRIRVEGIEQLYQEFLAQGEDIIHPNGKLESKPWGCKEFVVLDKAGVCITFYDFVE